MRNGYGAFIWGDENGLKPDSADGCKILNTYKNELYKGVNVLVC